MLSGFPFDNSYARLPDRFSARLNPTPVAQPRLIALNEPLAQDLGLDPAMLRAADGIAAMAGNKLPANATPLAQAYAGHQFGGWSPQLGDGRAILLGELDTEHGRFDLQLKGAGRTPFSRMGDGRAWLGPVIREYLISEAMHTLAIATTRSLAALETGEYVLRETPLPGAILVRIAKSHIRVGTFQYFAARQDKDALEKLTIYAAARHYPKAQGALGLLSSVIHAQASLIAAWMSIGFIHGVMNTDNMTISGETIDYGPCAFLDEYDQAKVFSSIDQFGRYAYGRQPEIGLWNLSQLANSLLPVIDENPDTAIAKARAALEEYSAIYSAEWQRLFSAKLGLATSLPGDVALIEALLDIMHAQKADFTRSFRGLSDGTARDEFRDPTAFDQWHRSWQARLAKENQDTNQIRARLRATNPAIIARNHRVEEVIGAALSGDYAPFHALHAALKEPFVDHDEYARAPTQEQKVTQTFCGT